MVSDLPWDKFLKLVGDPRRNWEVLCREVIRRHYERHGPLLTQKQQPGVEFHLTVVHGNGALGETGRHWGWQCRWYESNDFWARERRLRSKQREDIEAAIAKSAEQVHGLSDWVLWTRERLSADDVRWFESLTAPFELHRWDEETLVGLLNGEAEILRETWFGDLVVDQAKLDAAREEALAPIGERYIEELHMRTPSEERIRNFLPDLGSDPTLAELEWRLAEHRGFIGTPRLPGLTGPPVEALEIASRSLWGVREAAEKPELPDQELTSKAAEKIGAQGDIKGPLSNWTPTQALLGQVRNWLAEIGERLSAPVIIAVGGGGIGKTHLAAALSGTAAVARGVFVLGRQFGKEFDGDSIARISGLAQTRDQLLEALEAIGAREGRRVPLIIDGLNESDDPTKWRDLLARLSVRMEKHRHVVVIATIRPSYRDFALPEGLPAVELSGLATVEDISIKRYFDYYKIDAEPDAIHWWRSSDPLMLSIFCKTANPDRTETVRAGDLPKSLHEVFDNYLEDVCIRVGRALKVEARAVSEALNRLALSFYGHRARELPKALVAEILDDRHWDSWEDSLRFHLEAEGILVRDVQAGKEEVSWSHDMLAGQAIARAVFDHQGGPVDCASGEDLQFLEAQGGLAHLASAEHMDMLSDHPLSEDILAGLTGLIAEARGVDVTELFDVKPKLRAMAARAMTRLAPEEVRTSTSAVSAFEQLFADQPVDALDALAPITLTAEHPLNGMLLDRLLGDLEVWERDLSWTEWVRGRSELLIEEVRALARSWQQGKESSDDRAAVVWLSWLLTTTDKPLYDEAVHALYRLGRRDPERLFARTLTMLDTNDRAVAAGLMAAAYGVAMATQNPSSSAIETVIDFATELSKHLLGEEATEPTSHWLIREYAYRTSQLAAWLSGGGYAAPTDAAQPPLPAPLSEVAIFKPGDTGWETVAGALRTDFSNYTIGQLVKDRVNYQDDHPRFRRITGEIRARVAQFGWTEERFGMIDRTISESSLPRSHDPAKTERYGKKYSWAGFYEAAGRVSDRRELQLESHFHEGWRLSDLPIDPSFPKHQVPNRRRWRSGSPGTARTRTGCAVAKSTFLIGCCVV